MPIFEDRQDAGRQLAEALSELRGTDGLILALPRGGVVVGYELSMALGLPLEVFISRKIGAPENPELAIGAIAEINGIWLDRDAPLIPGVTEQYVREEAARQKEEIRRRIQMYRDGEPLPHLSGRTVVVVDDGVATGYTMLAALRGLRLARPSELVAAVPVAPGDSLSKLMVEADRVVCLATPEPFYAVGFHFASFHQLSDEDVIAYLEQARRSRPAGSEPRRSGE